MKAINFLVILMLLMAGFFACGQEGETKQDTTAQIVGYVKCPSYTIPETEIYSNDIIIGLYIVSSKKDSLVAYNIPHPTIEHLLGVDINALGFGLNGRIDNVPIDISYRKANNNELILPICIIYGPGPSPDLLHKSMQIIILNINKEEIK